MARRLLTTKTKKKSPIAPIWVWLTVLTFLIVGSALLDWMFLGDKKDGTEESITDPNSEGYTELLVDTIDQSASHSGLTSDTSSIEDPPLDSPPTSRGGVRGGSPVESSKPSPQTPWIALIIDDFGPSGTYNILPYFLDLPIEFTVSVIPGNPKSAECGLLTSKGNRELFAHLPMEPKESIAMDEQYMLFTTVSQAQLTTTLDRITAELPDAIGLNNHMGSKATLDESLMTMLALELKKRNLMFYDSWTIRGTVAHKVMVANNVTSIKRDVFLDNVRDIELIDKQFQKLVRIAKQRGYAVATGHCNRITLQYLQQNMPIEGVRFVSVGTLARALQK